jgi:hypothetical protein
MTGCTATNATSAQQMRGAARPLLDAAGLNFDVRWPRLRP